MNDRGWAWDVYPRSSSNPMVATGQSSSQRGARVVVETVLAEKDSAAWGLTIGPAGETDVCRRGREDGTFVWRPLFCEPEPAIIGQ